MAGAEIAQVLKATWNINKSQIRIAYIDRPISKIKEGNMMVVAHTPLIPVLRRQR